MRSKITKKQLIDFQKRIAEKWNNREIPYPVHLSGGNEDELMTIFDVIKSGDYIFSTHRSHYHYLLAGGSLEKLEKKILEGKSMHIFDRELNFLSSSIVAGNPAIAAGTALALKKNKSNNRVWCFIGDGAEDEGHFYEAVRYVYGQDLPCTFIIEDNNRSVETPKRDRYGESSEIKWPSCVKRYHYKAEYPHVGLDWWVDFSGVTIKKHELPKRPEAHIPLRERQYKGTYKDALKEAMNMLSENERTIFLGNNICYGSRAYGTLESIPLKQKLEMPVAENLMVGVAIGLSLERYKPVVFFERHDFILNSLDSIVNHLDKIGLISDGEFQTPVIIRAPIGSKKPLYPGEQHVGNYTESFKNMVVSFPIYEVNTPDEIMGCYINLKDSLKPAMVVEKRELYDTGKVI